MGFDHWVPCATASVMYLKKQKSEAICCVIFQTYCVTKNQIIWSLFTKLVSLSPVFHLEYCKQLERENHQQYLTLSHVIYRLCNISLNTIQKHYKHSQSLYCHIYWAVCVNNTDKIGYVQAILYLIMPDTDDKTN